MNFLSRVRWLMVPLALTSVGSAATLLDGGFAGWTFEDTALGHASGLAVGSGGSPDAYLELTLTQDSSGDLTRLFALSTLSYTPALSGAIGSLTLQMDVQRPSWAQQGFGLVLGQGGNV